MDKVETNPKGLSADSLAKIAPTLQPIVDSGDLSGFVTLTFRHGEIAQLNTLGYRDIEKKLPMERDTLFRIASMTKPVTSIAALMLWEEGKLKLEDPIAKWLPEFSGMRVLKDASGPVNDTYPAPREITVEDLKKRLDQGEDLFILDVRNPEEYQICRLPGSTLLPLPEMPQRFAEVPKDREVVVHCKSGMRSAKAIGFLMQHGYDKLKNLKGGILAWAASIDPGMPRY